MLFDSGAPGPVLGITVCTHGNEPSGLAAVAFLREVLSHQPLLMGAVYVVVNNLRATELFFQATDDQTRRNTRYVDINMNRLPVDTLELCEDDRYEVRRAQELRSIWEKFTVALDVHSTTSPVDPMIISKGTDFGRVASLVHGFPIRSLLTNIDSVQLNRPVLVFYGSREINVPAFAIETGQHTSLEAFERAVACTQALLANLGMLPGVSPMATHEFIEYPIKASLFFSDQSFDLIQDFRSYDLMREGDVIARNTVGEELYAPFDGHLIFPTEQRGADKDLTEEISFFSSPSRIWNA
ncbi:MAG: succinylglutamate desuccinylase/aspartoacylase family protein [Patescibacteria group bacterium]